MPYTKVMFIHHLHYEKVNRI